MGLTVTRIAAGVALARARMATLEQELNVADARLGDGDTGGMLRRVLDFMAEQQMDGTDDVGASLGILARAAAAATGSSLGTLLATGLLTMSKRTKGRTEIPWSELAPLLEQARDAVMARGGAKLGDKTVVDALDAVSTALAGAGDQDAVRARAIAACDAALVRFRNEPCRMGRARMYADKSIGMDDPGMLAFARLIDSVCRRGS
ncbi:DAK2 domain-containing protein [Azospirillum sp.]|uniref:DAK2 domain-containing protein n=1 Tax=Azospirillum sp. TaxID=34012 RepID=UPI003D7321FE